MIDLKWYNPKTFNTQNYKKNIKILKSLNLEKNSIFIDAGAHRGEELNYLSNIGCTVYSFEIHPIHFKNLSKMYGDRKNIFIYNNALTNISEKEIPCFYKKTSIGGSMSIEKAKGNIDPNRFVMVKSIKLSDFILDKNIEKIDVLKMDVEGAEFKIIEDLIDSKTIEKISVILYEDHDGKFKKKKSKEWKSHRGAVKEKMKAYKQKFRKWH